MRPFEHFLNVNLELKIHNHKSVMKFFYVFFVTWVCCYKLCKQIFKYILAWGAGSKLLVPKHMPDPVLGLIVFIDRFRLDQKLSSPFSLLRRTLSLPFLSSRNRWEILTKLVSKFLNGIGNAAFSKSANNNKLIFKLC